MTQIPLMTECRQCPTCNHTLLHDYKFQSDGTYDCLMVSSYNIGKTTGIFHVIKWPEFSSVQYLSWVQLSATPRNAARQASLSVTNSRSFLKLMSIESVMASHHLVLSPSHLQSFPVSRSFQMSQFLASDNQNIGVSASASVLPMCIQGRFPLGWTGWFSVQSKGLLKSLQQNSSNASIFWCKAFFMVQFSHPRMTTRKTFALTRQTFVGKVMSLRFNMLSRLVIAFLPRSKHLLIS